MLTKGFLSFLFKREPLKRRIAIHLIIDQKNVSFFIADRKGYEAQKNV